MLDATPAGLGHNNPPDPLEALHTEYAALIEITDSTLTGDPVINDAQMRSVDSLREGLGEFEKAVKEAKEGEYRPHKAACDKVVTKYAPTLKDLDTRIKACKAMVNDYKAAKRRAEEEADRAARAEAYRKEREAKEAAARANAADIEAQQEVMRLQAEAEAANRRAAEAARGKTTGLRMFTETVVLDHQELARLLWNEHRAELEAAHLEIARRLKLNVPGVVEQRSERRAV